MLAIIDADSILYKVALSGQQRMYIVDGKEFPEREPAETYAHSHNTVVTEETVKTGTLNLLVDNYNERIGYIRQQTKATDTIAYTGATDGNFRHAIATIKPYKGNRTKTKAPLFLSELKGALIKLGKLLNSSSGMEADDQVIIEYLKAEANDIDVVLCTIDKDAKQLYGNHYNFDKDELYAISYEDSLRNLYGQLLTGDGTDNIPGLFGVGGKSKLVKDLQLFDTEQEMFKFVLGHYSSRFGNYAKLFMCENFRLLYMNRIEDIENGLDKFEELYNATRPS